MGEMIIKVTNTTMVRPSQVTPERRVWVSNPDLIAPRYHLPNIYFYRPSEVPNFFEPNLLKEALSRALIPYYPLAGRLRRDAGGRRIEIDCNSQGVLFVEAETTSVVDDFGDFSPTMEYTKLIPSVDYSSDISSYPLLLLQITYFGCGGVSIGVGMYHLVADGLSRARFINAWGEMARGVELSSMCSPSIDRTLLRAQEPPCPTFDHAEYLPSPVLVNKTVGIGLTNEEPILSCIFHMTRDQINALKKSACKGDGSTYTSFEILSGHIWRCVCRARGLEGSQASKLYVPVDARNRLEPKLPPTYFGNAVFMATPIATSGDLVSKPASYAAHVIHEAIARMDDSYIRSALDYMELRLDNDALLRGSNTYVCPNMVITSWTRFPIYEADFGWGAPIFVGPGWIITEGSCVLVPTPLGDGAVSLVITLQSKHIQLFDSYLYQI